MTDTTKTRDQLVDMAADELGLTSTGNGAEAEDTQKIDAKVDGLFLELSARGVCDVSDEDAIPIEWTDALALLLADLNASAFGKPRMGHMDRIAVEERIKVMVQRVPPARETLTTDRALRGAGRLTLSRWSRGY
jgi:hypothetical protein